MAAKKQMKYFNLNGVLECLVSVHDNKIESIRLFYPDEKHVLGWKIEGLATGNIFALRVYYTIGVYSLSKVAWSELDSLSPQENLDNWNSFTVLEHLKTNRTNL